MSQTLNGRAPVGVSAHTANFTLTANDSGTMHTNAGAAGTITASLPSATVGLHFWFLVKAAQELRLDPSGTQTIGLPSSGAQQAAGKYLSADAVGEWVRIVCAVAGTWDVLGYAGTWSIES